MNYNTTEEGVVTWRGPWNYDADAVLEQLVEQDSRVVAVRRVSCVVTLQFDITLQFATDTHNYTMYDIVNKLYADLRNKGVNVNDAYVRKLHKYESR